MRARKHYILIGFDADGEPKTLYLGEDGGKAQEIFDKPPAGVHFLALHNNPTPWRSRETEEARVIRDAMMNAHQAEEDKNRAKAEAEAKAAALADEKAKAAAAQKAAVKTSTAAVDTARAQAARRAEILKAAAEAEAQKAK